MAFPNHSYNFQDSVYLPNQGKGGFIQSIRHEPVRDQWLYQLTTTGDHWWSEDELSDACPRCLALQQPDDNQCSACGFRWLGDKIT